MNRRVKQARMAVPKFVCEVACASGFASYMDDDVPWDTRSIVQKERLKSIALEKGNLGTGTRAKQSGAVLKCSELILKSVRHR